MLTALFFSHNAIITDSRYYGHKIAVPRVSAISGVDCIWLNRRWHHLTRLVKGNDIVSQNLPEIYASVNSSCTQQPLPGRSPGHKHFFFALDGKFPGLGLIICHIPRGGDGKRGQMPRPPSTLQHYSLIAQSNSAVLSILMCIFLLQLASSFVIALDSVKTSRRNDMHQFMISIF